MLKFPIYLDYSATTPVDPRVAEKMIPYLCEHFGNPASRSHAFGWEAEKAVEEARADVAALVNADPREIVWTSGATESNNLALKGAAHFYKGKGKHLVTVATEHKAVLDSMRELEREGFEVTVLPVAELDRDAGAFAEQRVRIDVVLLGERDDTEVEQPAELLDRRHARQAQHLATQWRGELYQDGGLLGHGRSGLGARHAPRPASPRLACRTPCAAAPGRA